MKRIQDMDVEDYLYESVHILPEAIQEEYVNAAPHVAYWGAKYADASQAALSAEAHRRQVKAQLYVEHRDILSAKGEKATEKLIEAKVEDDPRLHEAIKAENIAEGNRLRMQAFFEAVKTKRDMLVSIGATQRKEMEGDPIIRSRARNARLGEDT